MVVKTRSILHGYKLILTVVSCLVFMGISLHITNQHRTWHFLQGNPRDLGLRCQWVMKPFKGRLHALYNYRWTTVLDTWVVKVFGIPSVQVFYKVTFWTNKYIFEVASTFHTQSFFRPLISATQFVHWVCIKLGPPHRGPYSQVPGGWNGQWLAAVTVLQMFLGGGGSFSTGGPGEGWYCRWAMKVRTHTVVCSSPRNHNKGVDGWVYLLVL